MARLLPLQDILLRNFRQMREAGVRMRAGGDVAVVPTYNLTGATIPITGVQNREQFWEEMKKQAREQLWRLQERLRDRLRTYIESRWWLTVQDVPGTSKLRSRCGGNYGWICSTG